MLEVNIESDQVIIIDPCYDKDNHFSEIVDILPGLYIANIKKTDNRISELIITHSDYYNVADETKLELISDDIGVDSGQCGFFDIKYYKNNDFYRQVERMNPTEIICQDEPFYSICCDRTIGKVRWGTIPFGVLSSSGYGDGCYSVYGIKSGDTFIHLKLVFILPHEEEE